MDNKEFAEVSKVYKKLRDYCNEDSRLCPGQEAWNKLYAILEPYEERRKIGGPPDSSSSSFTKQMRLSDHLELASKNGIDLMIEVDTFLRKLKKDSWEYV